MESRVVRPEPTADPALTREVDQALEGSLLGFRSLTVLAGSIKETRIRALVALFVRRYDDRARQEGVAFDRAALELITGDKLMYSLQIATTEILTIVRSHKGWDFCLQIAGSCIEASILRLMLESPHEGIGATSLTVSGPGAF